MTSLVIPLALIVGAFVLLFVAAHLEAWRLRRIREREHVSPGADWRDSIPVRYRTKP